MSIIKKTILILGLLFFATNVMSDSQVKFAGGAVDNASTGTVTWANPNLAIGGTNQTYAQATVDGTISHYLYLTNYAFSIPTNSTINGVVVTPMRKSDRISNGGSLDRAVRLITNGVIGSTDRSSTNTYGITDVAEDHGGVSDTWGITLTPTIVNSSGFGTAFSTTKPDPNGQAHIVDVDFIRITVYYTLTSSEILYKRKAKSQSVY